MNMTRCYEMYAQGDGLTRDVVGKINDWLKARHIIGWALRRGVYGGNEYEIETEEELRDGWAEWESYDSVEWEGDEDESYEDVMTDLSFAFPDVTFCLHAEGTGRDDVFDGYWLNGDHEMCWCHFEIPEPVRIKWDTWLDTIIS